MTYQLTQRDIDLCRWHANLYREVGFNPLPSSYTGDVKKPLCTYAQYFDEPMPESEFNKFDTPSLQVVTGRRWGLMVIDLDSEKSFDVFNEMGPVPQTWISLSPGGGAHLWFRVPREGHPLKKGFLWESEERREIQLKNWSLPRDQKLRLPHEAIERIADRSLIMAPPSIHPKMGEPYKFDHSRVHSGRFCYNSPKGMVAPAWAPDWLLDMPLMPPVAKPAEPRPERLPEPVRRLQRAGKPWQQVIDEIPDKTGLAEQWGLKFARGGSGGWLNCYAAGREENRPSARFHPEKGMYVDFGQDIMLSLPSLAVLLGVYSDFGAAMDDLRARYERP